MTVVHSDQLFTRRMKDWLSLSLSPPPTSVFSPTFFLAATDLLLPVHFWCSTLTKACGDNSTWVSVTHLPERGSLIFKGQWRSEVPCLILRRFSLIKPTSFTALNADFQHSLNNWAQHKDLGISAFKYSPLPGAVICWLASATNPIMTPHHCKISGSLSFLPLPNGRMDSTLLRDVHKAPSSGVSTTTYSHTQALCPSYLDSWTFMTLHIFTQWYFKPRVPFLLENHYSFFKIHPEYYHVCKDLPNSLTC